MRISDWSSDVCSSDLTLYPFLTELKRYAGITDEDKIQNKREKLESVLARSDVPLKISLPIFAALLSLEAPEKEAIPGISVEQPRKCTKKIFTDWIRHVDRVSGLLLVFEVEQWAVLTSWETDRTL